MDKIKVLNMYYGSDVVNSIFIHELDTLVIIDTGIKDKKEKILNEIAKYEFKKLFVILTHAHPDHIGNNYAIKESYKPIFIANINSKRYLEDYKFQFDSSIEKIKDYFHIKKEIRDFYFGLMDEEVKIDISFYNQMVIDLGKRRLKIIHLPGHTLGDIGVLDRKNNTLILSELVFNHSRDILICLEDYSKYVNSLKVIEKIVKEEDMEHLITSHHEKAIEGKKKILETIQYNIDYINELKLDTDKLYKSKYSIEEIAKEICRKRKKEYMYISIDTVRCMID